MNWGFEGINKNIDDISLQDIRNMDAEKLLKKYNCVEYSKSDIFMLNLSLNMIKAILKKYTNKLGGQNEEIDRITST